MSPNKQLSYQFSSVLLAHIILMDYRPYLVSLPIQNLVPNIQNLVYFSTPPNVTCRKRFIPHVSIPLIENAMEQNLVGFPHSMYLHVGPYTPNFGFGYRV
jgi:hypothetical protein